MAINSGVAEQVVSLPNGGGDLKGLGETFSSDRFTGTGSYIVPIAVPAGRCGLTPSITLAYSTGNGNGPCGVGWTYAPAAFMRRTDTGVPSFDDAADTFVVAGFDELTSIGNEEYRPRTDNAFARIKHVKHAGDDYWVVVTKSGLRHVYGRDRSAQVYSDVAGRRRIFAWHLNETEDTLGNRIVYVYKSDRQQELQHDINQTYLKEVYWVEYGVDNMSPHQRRWLYRLIFDYGEDERPDWNLATTLVDPNLPSEYRAIEREAAPTSSLRPDPFSSCSAGFEIRTRRRCWRIRVQVRPRGAPAYSTTRAYYLRYGQSDPAGISLLKQVRCVGFRPTAPNRSPVALPSLGFSYTEWDPTRRIYENCTATCGWLPDRSLADPEYEIIDLDGSGLPGVLQTSSSGHRYWRNLGRLRFASPPHPMPRSPEGATLADPSVALADMDGDGSADLLISRGALTGYWRNNFSGEWEEFVPYSSAPALDVSDPDVRLVDLDGDHRVDALGTFADYFVYYRNRGSDGWGEPAIIPRIQDLDLFPNVRFSESGDRVRFADMNGDGLQDIVAISPGRIDYWPSLGHGRFGRRVTMKSAPNLGDAPDYTRIFLADLNGDGCADLVQIEFDHVVVCLNQSGNSWSSRAVVEGTPTTLPASVRIADLKGTGTAGILWTYDRSFSFPNNYKFLDLTGGVKPGILCKIDNGMGGVTAITVAPSTEDYIRDWEAAAVWRTKLPFPLQVVRSITSSDEVTEDTVTSTFFYHHGLFVGREYETRGFGYVEELDVSPALPHELEEPKPSLRRYWFHLGVPVSFEDLYFANVSGLPARAPSAIEAQRALRGMLLRSESFGLDRIKDQKRPYQVESFAIAAVQSGPVWTVQRPESVIAHLERGLEPRTVRYLYAFDVFGNVTRVDEIGEGRSPPPAGSPTYRSDQTKTLHRAQIRSYAILDRSDPGWSYPYRPGRIVNAVASIRKVEVASDGTETLLEETKNYYDGRPFLGLGHPEAPPLPAGAVPVVRGLPSGRLDLALSPSLEAAAYGANAPQLSTLLDQQGSYFVDASGQRWGRLNRRQHGSDGLMERIQDARGGEQRVRYDSYRLFPIRVTDPAGLITRISHDVWAGAPRAVADPNGNESRYAFDGLGRLVRVAYQGKRTAGTWEGDTLAVPTSEWRYNLGVVPALLHTRHRELRGDAAAVHETYTYFDGMGRVIQERVESDAGRLVPDDPASQMADPRWSVSGLTIYNRKGLPRRVYKPYFAGGYDFQLDPAGQTSSFTRYSYDPLGRETRIVTADGSLITFQIDAWSSTVSDANDNGGRASLSQFNPESTRFSAKYPSPPATHFDTPRTNHFDAYGRTIAVEENNGVDGVGASQLYFTRFRFNVLDELIEVYDARGSAQPTIQIISDPLGRQLAIKHATAAGTRTAAFDAAGNRIFEINGRGIETSAVYDVINRLVEVKVDGVLREAYRYRTWNPNDLDARSKNLFGPAETVFDGAGRIDYVYDHMSRIRSATRWVRSDAGLNGAAPDSPAWDGPIIVDPVGLSTSQIAQRYLRPSSLDPALAPLDAGFRLGYVYNSFGRISSIEYPDGRRLGVHYSRAGLPDRLELVSSAATTPIVRGVDYDAFAARREIIFGNDVVSTYKRDADNRRLSRLQTGIPGRARRYQDLSLAYDPQGNITSVLDGLQSRLVRDGRYVPNTRTFDYDPLNRLIRATGRKRRESCIFPARHGSHGAQDEWPLRPHPADHAAMQAYAHIYRYDQTGNVLESDDYGSADIRYKLGRSDLFAGGVELAPVGEAPDFGNYRYDLDGNLIHSPELDRLSWDQDSRLTLVDMLGGGSVRFAYDVSGNRVLKRVRRSAATQRLTIYILDRWELTIERRPSFGSQPRHSMASHVILDNARIAIAEEGTFPNREPILFLHADQIGSAHVVTRGDGSMLSQEEYFAFGRSSDRRHGKNKYRFAGRERDEETKLYYFGGRYYDCSSGRFISADPLILSDTLLSLSDPQLLNMYSYCKNNPVTRTDSTGFILDTIADVAFILIDVGTLVYDEVANDGKNRTENLLALGADVAGALVPFATGGGLAVRAASKADDVVKLANRTDDVKKLVTSAERGLKGTNQAEKATVVANRADDVAHAVKPAPGPKPVTPTKPKPIDPPSRPAEAGGGGAQGPPKSGGGGAGDKGGKGSTGGGGGSNSPRVEPGGAEPNDVLVRRGTDKESAQRLGKQAESAETAGFPHGVSVTTPESNLRLSRDPTDASSATREAFEKAGFPVHHTPTTNDPMHHTVELPKPVTSEAAAKFNSVLGR